MMKKSVSLLFVTLFLTILVQAQNTPSPYEVQRSKVNQLLSERSAKFSQYDKSLVTRSGIFGLQTKKDIRNSNEILRQIVITDNEIFQELKVLLDYKDLQMQEVNLQSSTSEDRILRYRSTIKDQQELLQKSSDRLKTYEKNSRLILILLVFLCLSNAFFVYRTAKRKLQSRNARSAKVIG